MPSSTLKIEGPDKVALGNRKLDVSKYDPPFKDGSSLVVEATSDPANRFQQKLLPSELSGVAASELPKGFQINVYRPEARTKGLDNLIVENLANGRRINVAITYYFADWAYRTNLGNL